MHVMNLFFFLFLLYTVNCRCAQYVKKCDTWNHSEDKYYITTINGKPNKYTFMKTIYDPTCKTVYIKYKNEYTISSFDSLNNGFLNCVVSPSKSQMYITSQFNDLSLRDCRSDVLNVWKSTEEFTCLKESNESFQRFIESLHDEKTKKFLLGGEFVVVDGIRYTKDGSCPVDWIYVFQWILSILIALFVLVITGICFYYQYRVVHSRKIRSNNFKQDQEIIQKESISSKD